MPTSRPAVRCRATVAARGATYEVSRFDAFSETHPRSAQRIVRNLAALLTKRLIEVNAKVDVLSAY